MDLDTSWDPLDLADDGWDRQTSNQDEDFTSEPDTSTATYLSQWTRPTTIPNAYHPQPQYIDPGYDFTSEQAAKALTSLSHSPTKGFDADDFLDCCQPCDQQCDPNEIFPCFSVDTVPCYDSTCSQTCELDGLNTLCNDIHTDGMEGILCCLHQGCTFQTLSEAELLHHCTIAHACGARTQWECRHQNFTETNTMQGHVHNEHCRDEFINPLLLHPDGCLKKPTIPSHYHTHRHQEVPSSHFQTFHTSFHSNPSSSSSACCHIPDKEGTCMHDHGILHTGKSERSRKSFDHGSVVSSRKTSISTPPSDWTCTSPVSSARSEPFGAVLDDRGGPRKVYSCCWIPEQSTTPCSLTFNSPLELQTHIEDFHLASCENLPVQQKAEQLICHWKGCPFAQTKKKWRQVQHLKDHLRTHTKREFLVYVFKLF